MIFSIQEVWTMIFSMRKIIEDELFKRNIIDECLYYKKKSKTMSFSIGKVISDELFYRKKVQTVIFYMRIVINDELFYRKSHRHIQVKSSTIGKVIYYELFYGKSHLRFYRIVLLRWSFLSSTLSFSIGKVMTMTFSLAMSFLQEKSRTLNCQ